VIPEAIVSLLSLDAGFTSESRDDESQVLVAMATVSVAGLSASVSSFSATVAHEF